MRIKVALPIVLSIAMLFSGAVPAKALTVSTSGPIVQLGSTNHWYQYISTTTTPTQAEAIAASAATTYNGLPGHLVTISSPDENAFVRSITGTDAVWIGAARTPRALDGTYDWAWLSGPEVGQSFTTCVNNYISCNNLPGQYTNWDTAHQQPDGDLWNEDAVEMEGSDLTSGAWGDCYAWGNCHISGFVIEYEPDWSATQASVAGLHATSKSSSTVSLAWSAPVVNGAQVVDYSIDYREANGSWTSWNHSPDASSQATLTGLASETAYQFRVAPIFNNGMVGKGVLATDSLSQVGDGEFHACSLSEDGSVQCWGNQGAAYGTEGLLGTGDLVDSVTPRRVLLPEPVSKLSVGAVNSCAIGLSQKAFCWGGNRFGELGVGTFNTNESTPKEVTALGTVADIASTESWIYNDQAMTCAVTTSGDGYCWGLGILGDGTTSNSSTVYQQSALPLKVAMPNGVKFKNVATSGYNTCFIATDNSLYCFGENVAGQAGVGQLGTIMTPTKVSGISDVAQVSMGWASSCAITLSGSAFCWGDNTWGQLGTGNYSSSNTPQLVSQSLDARFITVGGTDTCSISGAGVLSCWGDGRWDRNGQSIGATNVPLPVDGANQYKSVSNGPESTCALGVNNQVRCWGVNSWWGISHFGVVTGWSSAFGPEASRFVVSTNTPARFTTTSNPVISGTPSVNQVLSANLPAWDSGAVSQWQWRKDGVNIVGATSVDYRVTTSDVGSVIDVSVTVTKLGYQSETKTSAAIGPVTPATQSAIAAPIISGQVRVDEVVFAQVQANVSQSTRAFQWLSGGVAITGETRSTLQIRPELVGASLSVRVTSSLVGYFDLVETSSTVLVAPANLTLVSLPVIVGNPVSGSNLTIDVRAWDPGVTFAFSWTRNGVIIPGQTLNQYAVLASDIGAVLGACVTGAKRGYVTQSVCSSGVTILSTQKLTPVPTISGTIKIGSTLTARPGTWDTGVVVSYQWLRNGLPIQGATSATYGLVVADVGSQISVAVTGAKLGYLAVTTVSMSTIGVPAGTLTLAPTPTISGSPKIGNVLTVTTGKWDTGVTLSYQWNRAGQAIAGANSTTYVVVLGDLGSTISVSVTGAKPGYAAQTKTSSNTAAVGVGTLTLTPVPTITGTATVGSTLTAKPGTWDAGVAIAYQWKRGNTVIQGAVNSTYVLTAAEKGFVVSVITTGSKLGYTTVAKTSAATLTVK